MGGPRLIDDASKERKKPVRVLVLGLSRTGTTSICAALRKLSYNPYQMRDLLAHPETIPLWTEAINLTLLPPSERPYRQKNRSIFPAYGKQDFDTLLGEYDAIADLPACLFYRELLEAYPDAKVIVTTRDYDDWEQSMQKSIWLLLTWRAFAAARWLGVTKIAPLARLMHLVFRVHNGNHYGGPQAREAYEKYYADVRALVPQHRRLEIECQKGSWAPLLEFLQEDEEEQKEKVELLGAYPNMDESASMEKGLRVAWWETLEWFLTVLFLTLVSIGGVFVIRHQDYLWGKLEDALMVFEPYVGFSDGPARKHEL